MDLLYYYCKISDELEDATNYIKKAFCLKTSDSDKSSLFKEMSSTELNHAKILMGMFENDYETEIKQFGENVPDFYKDTYKSMNKMYLEQSTTIQVMHQQYSNK